MRIRTITQVNSRWLDGRTYAAGEGTVSVVDDGDRDAVAHMRYLAGVGQVEILAEDPEPDPEQPEMVDKIADREVKDSRQPELADPLAGLRSQAQLLGIRVDRRWGADRLRDEISAVEGVKK
jgi:hypothetical protein